MDWKTLADVYLTDFWTETDQLGFSDFQPALRQILLHGRTPLTVGVFGAWGSGKTSLLRMLKREIDASDSAVRAVWFTASKYDRQGALSRAFLLRVLDALYPREDSQAPWEERLRITEPKGKQKEVAQHLERLQECVYRPVEWKELGEISAEWGRLLPEAARAAGTLAAALLPGDEQIQKMVAGLLGPKHTEPDLMEAVSALRREVRTYHREQLASMEQFEGGFREALALAMGESGRLVVLVDDLDRCLPEKAVEVLEAIKLFLEVPGTVFVLGMDAEVIGEGIEARYRNLYPREGGARPELPVSGAAYLQKIVQIPFHLPSLGVGDVERFIDTLTGDLDLGARLSETTRGVFARGVFPNPRQVKRVLNIFHLLQEIALAREANGSVSKGCIAWPLLAKTVLIQAQWPELYREWRLRPTLIRSLEEHYERRPSSQKEIELGRLAEARSSDEDAESERAGGILGPFVSKRRHYALLEEMLSFPPRERAGDRRELARFGELERAALEAYLRLAGTVSTPEAESGTLPALEDLRTECLSADRARIEEAAARLQEREPNPEGAAHRGLRDALLAAMRESTRPAGERASAGDALALIGDPRFREERWFLPDEPTLGLRLVEEGEFRREGDERKGPTAERDELKQHMVSPPDFWMARWPVTVAQYRAFVEGSGYTGHDAQALQGLDNRPVVHVSWHDAMAYCRWLDERLRSVAAEQLVALDEAPSEARAFWEGMVEGRLRADLPSEAEWEKAARGADGRIYPWGEAADPERANYRDACLGQTSAVGCFPDDSSPYGCEDLSGNVWEWTRSLWGGETQKPAFLYPYDPKDVQEDLSAANDVLRVLRGGSFDLDAEDVRCAYRVRRDPGGQDCSVGFRVVVSPFFSEF